MNSDNIRTSFLEFFAKRDHVIERSDRLVPSNDPTLMFTSAGMVQFKPYYTGAVEVPYRRAATAQKCLRAGGKANDLDEVGKTARHLTFFEMLGNFSFGDYFKQEAIAWAWEYTTGVLGMNGNDIWVSVYKDDDEAHAIWEKEIGLPAKRIVRLGDKENFWGPAGDTGACGPCSELHLDRGASEGCGREDCAPGCEYCERFLEFWNLVFPQFDQQADGSRPTLKNRGIDTGMGLERLAAILQDKETVFDTDGIFPIIEHAQSMCDVKYAENPVPFRVMADHIRALSFMIADGILPGNEGRGYVLRRLLRRAARFGRELGFERPFLHQLSASVVELLGHHYTELVEARTQIQRIIQTEEERFASTLARGMEMLEATFDKMREAGAKSVPGEDLFKLHDTFGFPLDLATDIAEERGYDVDRQGFEAAMQKQREKGRSAWAGSGEAAVSDAVRAAHKTLGDSTFVGYDTLGSEAAVVALFQNGQAVETLNEGDEGELALDQTPFYAESGGQVGDAGLIEGVDGAAHVSHTKAPLDKFILHSVKVTRGKIAKGDTVHAQVDVSRRNSTMLHHTATHLLHKALQDTLGDHVHQAGSLVAPDRLRFDFTHFEAIPKERLADIEREVNRYIRTDSEVRARQMPLTDAKAAGAMALFGEKYGDIVRVIEIGDISKELCGGTHVPATGVIGFFKILHEASVAAGVRRIEAVCGEHSVDAVQSHENTLSHVAQMLNTSLDHVDDRVEALIEENRRLEREATRWKQAAATGGSVDYMSQVQQVDGAQVLAAEVPGQDSPGLRMVLDSLRDKLPSGVVILGSASDGKAYLCVGVSDDLTERLRAGDIVKQLAPIVGGGGGGKADMAQAGGKFPDKLPDAIAQAPDVVRKLLG